MNPTKKWLQDLPKAELHIHIEGSLEPEMMLSLAARNGVSLQYSSLDEVKEAYQFNCLQDFLDLYYQGMSVLLTEQDFFDLTWAYLQRCAADHVVHTEIFFDPQGHTARGVAFGEVIEGIYAALVQAEKELGITSRLIMCFLRHLSEASAQETLHEARPWLDRIEGVGLDSSELGHPPGKFKNVFAEASALGLRRVAHAGEEGPPEYVREALDVLDVHRIDHGNRAMEDDALVARLARSGVPLTVCPLSNQKLQVCPDLSNHPIRAMLKAGLRACVNSDDPAYFGGYVNANFNALIDAISLSESEIRQLVRNSFRGSFLPQADIDAHLARIPAG